MKRRFYENLSISRIVPALCVACLVAALAAPAAASPPGGDEERERRVSEPPATRTYTTGAIRVIYDPETGEIISAPFRETGVLSAPLAKALSRSTGGLQVFELANGGTGVHLDGRFQHALMVRVKADGSLETVCTCHTSAAEDFLHAGSAGAKAAPRDK
jgi:hypothetical protein